MNIWLFQWQNANFRVPTLLESPRFFLVQFPGPGKSWKMGLVLESPGYLSARSWKVPSWNFLGYDNDVGGGQNDAGADAEICVFAHLYRLFR